MKKQAKIKRSRITRRLGFHFTLQFFTTWLLVLAIALISIFTITYYIGNEQLKTDSPTDILDSLSLETLIEDDSVDLPSFWPDRLAEKGYWLQIVNVNGQEVYAANMPDDVPKHYSASDLLRISDTRMLKGYRVTTLYEEFMGSRNLYLLDGKMWMEHSLRSGTSNMRSTDGYRNRQLECLAIVWKRWESPLSFWTRMAVSFRTLDFHPTRGHTRRWS